MNTASRTCNEHSANAFLWFRFDKTTWQSLLAIWAVSGCAKVTNTCVGSVEKNKKYLWDGENFHFCKWAQWYQILLLEFKSILNVIAWHQFIYCSIRCYESVEFYLAKKWLLWWQYNTFNFVWSTTIFIVKILKCMIGTENIGNKSLWSINFMGWLLS